MRTMTSVPTLHTASPFRILLLLLFLTGRYEGEVIGDKSPSPAPPHADESGDQQRHPDVASKENTFKEFYLKAEKERSKSSSSNPSVDEIISGIMQLIGNVNGAKPASKARPNTQSSPAFQQHEVISADQEAAFGRINNRGPAFANQGSSANANLFHPSVLIGPGPPAGLPLPLTPFHKINKPPAHFSLPPKSSFNFQEKNLTALLGQKFLQLPKDSYNNFRRVPGNTILPKPLPPQRDRDGIGSQLQPEFLAPPAFVPTQDQRLVFNLPKRPADLSSIALQPDKRPNSIGFFSGKNDRNHDKDPHAVQDNSAGANSDPSLSSSSSYPSGRATIMPSVTSAGTYSSDATRELDVIRPTPTTVVQTLVPSESSVIAVSADSGSVGETSTESEWFPVGLSGPKASKSWSEEPPVIITQEDPVSVFDITIRHKLGAGIAPSDHNNRNVKVTLPALMTATTSVSAASGTSAGNPRHGTNSQQASSSPSTATTKDPHLHSATLPSSLIPTAAAVLPTVTASSSSTAASHSSSVQRTGITPTRSRPVDVSASAVPVATDDDVVYGKPVETNGPVAPSIPEVTVLGSGFMSTSQLPASHLSNSETTTGVYQKTPMASLSPYGRPIVVPVDVDEVRPKMGSGGSPPPPLPAVVTDPGQGSVYIDGRPTHFKIRHAASPPTLQVGSQVSVKPGANDHPRAGSLLPGHRPALTLNGKPGSVRRPPFRPRPAVPLVRIDTCIVGDETTCEVKMNERCKTEIGISSCQCKPGFGRSTSRGMCNPIVTLAVSLRLDKMGEKQLTFNRNFMNPNSEEYQFLEYETIQGFNSMLSLSRLAKVFMGVRVNKFYTAAGKLLVNASIDLEQNNATKATSIRRVLQQEIGRVIALSNSNIGDSQLSVEASASSVPRIEDVNECSSPDLNDCSPHATCANEFGSFRCVCKKGYDDKFAGDPKKTGRYCSSCSPQYCSNRGECHIVDGERECRCRGNFIGSKCDIDVEVLGVAVGGSVAALVIIVITFLCLYMWNQK